MLEAIKGKIWDILKHREVSLAMILDGEGRILWRRGRAVSGERLENAGGFCRSAVQQFFHDGIVRREENVTLQVSGSSLSQSARRLKIRSVMVIPLEGVGCLYVDSGTREGFSPEESEWFCHLGELLADSLRRIARSGEMPGGICGVSEAAARLRRLVVRYAIEEDPVLLTGETGVGKNHVAELIHHYSGRKGRMVTIHTPSIPENLLETELFGCRRGAFSGAVESRSGLVREAEGGTLFLDEISEIPPALQAKLLQFIERRTYRPVGENRLATADVRILAAANRSLPAAVREGAFRQDLFYRLNVLPIHIPPLRERPEDIAPLVRENLRLLRGAEVAPPFLDALRAHHWPGNVRELLSVLRRCGVMAEDLGLMGSLEEILSEAEPSGLNGVPPGTDPFENYDPDVSFWEGPWRDFVERRINRGQMRAFLKTGFDREGGVLKRLARRLHIADSEYPRFVSMLHKYGIHPRKGHHGG